MNITTLFETIDADKSVHSCSDTRYKDLKQEANKLMNEIFGDNRSQTANFPDIGTISLPYFKMGNIDSVNLFDLDELIIFSIYKKACKTYKKCIDVGANIGLHSIIMGKLGMDVVSYEPDPVHYSKLKENISINKVESRVIPQKAAVSNKSGKAQFTRVLGNTTGSHLSGAKQDVYGELETFEVEVASINTALENIDMMKLDAEGEEKNILMAIDKTHWESLDVIAEIGSVNNSKQIFEYLKENQINIFAQKFAWEKIETPEQMPRSYKEGSVFISKKDLMPWI